MFENHSQDTRYTGPIEKAPTVLSTYGTGGNNQPFVIESSKCFDVRFTSEGTKNASIIAILQQQLERLIQAETRPIQIKAESQ